MHAGKRKRVSDHYFIYYFVPLAAGFLLDLLFGDPKGLYHPVCLIGNLIAALEKGIRRLFQKQKAGNWLEAWRRQ